MDPDTPHPAAMTGRPTPEPARTQVHRRCVFDLWLDCGHIATVAVDGWYPVSVVCCNRLGGTILRGSYVPYASHVDYARVLSERYEHQPEGTPLAADRLVGRRPRTDGRGRYPARVGATWSLDGSHATAAAAPLTHP